MYKVTVTKITCYTFWKWLKKNASALNDTQYGFNCYKRVEDLIIFTQIPEELSHGSFCTKKTLLGKICSGVQNITIIMYAL